ncbi:MAG: SLBB domain-containing protein [Candidatus Rokuibacteriota bacterium]
MKLDLTSLPPGARVSAGPDYRLGPGDLLDVQITGRMESSRQQAIVGLDGTASFAPVGAVQVGGLTLLDAHRAVADRARALFRFADVSVTVLSPRAFEIVLAGEVHRPGTVLTTATRRVQDLILAAGGVTPGGSLRRIVVTRKGIAAEIDLLAFELRGDLRENPLVEEDTIVYVPPRGPSVTLAGAVQRPGDYEIPASGSLAELLQLTGGFSQRAALSEARLTRVGPDGRKQAVSVDLRSTLTPPGDLPLRAGDLLFVPSLGILQDVVELRGAFNGTAESSRTTTAGRTTIIQRFELAQGERIRDLVRRAGGIAAYADLRQAAVERLGTAGPRQRIPVDLHRLLVERDDAQDIVLENGDVLTLPAIEDKVYVVGEVRAPGPVDYRPTLTPREYVALAGGPGVRARLTRSTVTFPDGRTYAMADAPPLPAGAVITVPEVAVRWWQDYVAIASAVTGMVAAYTGLFLIFDRGLD